MPHDQRMWPDSTRDEVGDVVGDVLGDVGDIGYALRRVRKYGWLRSLYNVFQFHKGERWRTFRRCAAEHTNDMGRLLVNTALLETQARARRLA